MIMLQPDVEVFEEIVPFNPDVCPQLTHAISHHLPIRLLFVHVHRP